MHFNMLNLKNTLVALFLDQFMIFVNLARNIHMFTA